MKSIIVGCLFMAAFNPIASAQDAQTEPPANINLPAAVHERCLSVLRDGLRSDEFWPSIHAAEGLTLGGYGAEVCEFLRPKLDVEKDDQRRCGLARELVRAGEWQLATIMLDILASDDPHGHVHAAESLYKVAEVGDGKSLRAAMQQTENSSLQLMASAALARCGDPGALALIRQRLAATDRDTRRIAAWILARIGDASDLPAIRKSVALAEDELERSYYENAMAALGAPDGQDAVHQNLTAEDPAVRTYAATFAGDARMHSVAEPLIDLLDDDTLDVRVRAAQSLLVLATPERSDDHSELIYSASEKHPRYTEGSIVRLADDSLLFAVTRFVDGGSDFSNAEIVARRSSDMGATWGEPRVLQNSTGELNVMSVTLRRLRAPHANRLAMFYLQKNSTQDLRVYVRFSDDEAASFGDPIRVTTEPGYHVMNNDRVVQLATGRLLAPVATTPDVHAVNHFVSLCWISDDNGQTWRKGKGEVDYPQRGAMEPEVIELTDGRVMMIVRTQLGHIAASYSEDAGDTWSEAKPLSDLQAPEAPATLRRVPATGHLLLVWNNTFTKGVGHGGRRTPLTAAISSDEGTSWQHIRDLETRDDQAYSYTSLIFVKEQAVMSYWEQQGNRLSSRFRSLPISWFYTDE